MYNPALSYYPESQTHNMERGAEWWLQRYFTRITPKGLQESCSSDLQGKFVNIWFLSQRAWHLFHGVPFLSKANSLFFELVGERKHSLKKEQSESPIIWSLILQVPKEKRSLLGQCEEGQGLMRHVKIERLVGIRQWSSHFKLKSPQQNQVKALIRIPMM